MYNPWPTILTKLRELRGLSREEAAHRAGVTPVTLYRWERGEAVPKLSNFPCIAEAFGCTTGELGYVFSSALFDHYEREVEEADAMDASQTLARCTLGPSVRPRPPLKRSDHLEQFFALQRQMEGLFTELMAEPREAEEHEE